MINTPVTMVAVNIEDGHSYSVRVLWRHTFIMPNKNEIMKNIK